MQRSLEQRKEWHQVLCETWLQSSRSSSKLFLFPRLKIPTEGHHFETVDKVTEDCIRALKNILEDIYRDAYDDLKFRWKRCINTGGANLKSSKVLYRSDLEINLNRFANIAYDQPCKHLVKDNIRH